MMGNGGMAPALRRMTDACSGERYLEDRGTGAQYRRTACALAWPAPPRPGCVSVLAEHRFLPTTLGWRRKLFLLLEYQADSPSELIETAESVLWRYAAPRIITPVDDDRALLVEVYNDARRREHKPPLRMEPPLAWKGRGEGLFLFYTSLLHARLVDDKTLYLCGRYGAQGEYREAQQEQEARTGAMSAGGSMLRWPALCALAWCVAAMDLDPLTEGVAAPHIPSGPADSLGGY